MPSPISSPAASHSTDLKQTDNATAEGAPSTVPSKKRQRDPSESPEIYVTGRHSKHPALQRSRSSSASSSSASTQEAKRFRDEVANHCEELRRQDSDVSGSPHSRLASAIVAMFEFDSPALNEAVISTLSNPDLEKTISPDQFFFIRLSDGATVTPFDDVLETLGSEYRSTGAASEVDRLIKDMQTFHKLIDACQASPHQKIRDAAYSYVGKTAVIFVEQALAMAPQQAAPDPDDSYLLDCLREAKAAPDFENGCRLLASPCKEVKSSKDLFSDDLLKAFHTSALRLAMHLPSHIKVVRIGVLAEYAGHLPLEDQLPTFKNCLSILADGNLSSDYATTLLEICIVHIRHFDHQVGGKAAIEVIKAAALHSDPRVLQNVISETLESLIYNGSQYSKETPYLDLVPVDDKIGCVVSAIQAVLEMPPGAARSKAAGYCMIGPMANALPNDKMKEFAKATWLKLDSDDKIEIDKKLPPEFDRWKNM